MKKFILGVLVGVAIVVAAIWHYSNKHKHVDLVKDDLRNAFTHTEDAIKDKLDSAHLSTDDIKDELARTGKIVREKVQGASAVVADAATDARIDSTIKAKLLRDPGMSTLSISVSTKDGVVTLSGTAKSTDDIRTAVKTAMDTDGVHKVVSTIQLK